MSVRYSKLSETQKQAIIASARNSIEWGRTTPTHAAAIAASNILVKDNRQWETDIGSDAYAAALAVLVHAGVFDCTYNKDVATEKCPVIALALEQAATERRLLKEASDELDRHRQAIDDAMEADRHADEAAARAKRPDVVLLGDAT